MRAAFFFSLDAPRKHHLCSGGRLQRAAAVVARIARTGFNGQFVAWAIMLPLNFIMPMHKALTFSVSYGGAGTCTRA